MKKSRIFIGSATIVLAITAFMATKANKIFVTFTTAVTSAGTMKLICTNAFTTIAAAGSQVYVCTSTGTMKPLFTKVSRTKVAYLK